jgi:hypothetical protein
MTYYALELITRPGLYICENSVSAAVVTFPTAEEADAYLWKSDCLIRLATKVSPFHAIGA